MKINDALLSISESSLNKHCLLFNHLILHINTSDPFCQGYTDGDVIILKSNLFVGMVQSNTDCYQQRRRSGICC